MDMFSVFMVLVALVLLAGAIASIIGHLRYQEQKQRLPEACTFLGLKERNESLVKENETLKAENCDLAKVVDEAKTKKEWLAENQALLLSVEEDRKKQEEAKAEYEGYLDKLSHIVQQVTDKSQELITLNTDLNRVKEELAQKEQLLEEASSKLDKTSATYTDLSAKNTALAETNETLSAKLKLVEKDLTNSQKTLDDVRAKGLQAQELFVTLDASVKALEEKKNDLEQKNQVLEEKTGALEEKADTLREEKAALEAKNAALLTDNSKWMSENEAAVRKLRELQEDIGALSDELQNVTAEHASKMSDLATYETRKGALLKEIEILEAAKREVAEAAGIHNDEDTLKDLWEPITFPNLSIPKKEKSEQDLLQETKNYIRGKKLYFPDRVIHAFHTSMKCNDISPITVLAGISGTGKSELPKCYAEGMGMHFSMLAVQPRWDSPQDLLGFYNYMENKYKATELARALVRFDGYNRASWGDIPKGCDDRSDRMLLVLLDEMNLARVEYYFSEFLSKLETRRGVNLTDAKDRVKAEIELELTGRSPLRIFPGRNILFTGTMNEDESTQTLSDKVLDRANVLRFGKPRSSDIAEKIKNYKKTVPRREGMTYACWQSWCTDAKDVKPDDQVTQWIDQLNNAMEELQKPFGHRVAQAIATYVANYPQGLAGGHEKELAFADQIEQRIMPKLRGIDLEQYDTPLRKIAALIEQTNDTALSKAFAKGCNPDSSSGVFMWQGIDRSDEN